MDMAEQGLQCGWAGCPEEFNDEMHWIRHVSMHVFTLKPNERTPWLGPPEQDPDPQPVTISRRWSPVDDDRSDGEDDDDDYRAFSQVNALSSPASTPPQPELPDSPDLSAKINGPSVSMITTTGLIRRSRSPDESEHDLSHRTSGSADDVEAELIPGSPPPSISASQSTDPNREYPQSPHLLSHVSLVQTQSQFPSANVNRFRRGTFQIHSPAQTSLRFGFGMNTPESQSQPAASQTLPDSSQVSAPGSQSQTNGNGVSWLNTQAFRPPETQGSYESD